MTSLTDRYVAATLRSIPAAQRDDIERELRASIADALEDQTEVEVLTELGDPSRLAASYADRPLHLIGPAVYLDYRRVLAILLSSIVPLIVVAVGVASFHGGAALPEALGAAANAALVVAMHLVLWTSLVFVVIDRTFARGRSSAAWSPLSLPELPAKRIDVAALVGGSVMSTVIAAVLIVMQAIGPGMISPPLWESGALLLVIVFAAASVAFDVVGYYVGWGVPQAISNAALSVLFVVTVVGVARGGELLNPVFFEDWPEGAGPDGVITWIIVIVITLLSITNALDGFARARTARASA